MFKNEYRIVEDNHAGYEVQTKKWWFPLMWFQCRSLRGMFTNTHGSISLAEKFIENHRRGLKVVKYVK